MLTVTEQEHARLRAATMLDEAGFVLTADERAAIEVADFGLSDLERTGLEIVVYVNTARVCAKELVLFPGQTCPEHRHPPFDGTPGKEETFRCRSGVVFLYVEGDPVDRPRAHPPRPEHVRAWHEIVLHPGQQATVPPDTLHWFQAGPEGAIVSEFSTQSRDDLDEFTDPDIQREPAVQAE
jgi:D-lyxose ketol-isomerase